MGGWAVSACFRACREKLARTYRKAKTRVCGAGDLLKVAVMPYI
ncbi:MAG: hypothetical protein ACJATT_005487, partial [Myxococcota bacterium]